MKHFDFKKVVVALLALIVVFAGGYKYYEWHSLSTLSEQYNKTWKQEFKLLETINKTFNDYDGLLTKAFETETPDEESIDKVLSKTKLIINQEENYLETIQSNKKLYQQLHEQPDMLSGNKKKFSDEIVKLQLDYYNLETERTNTGLVLSYFLLNIFTIQQEGLIISDFEAQAQGDPTYYTEHFGEMAVFKKYTEDDYTFLHQEDIKKHYPKAYDMLLKYKTFYATFYEVMEDMAKGDEDSAAYKSAKLQEQAVELNVDPKELIKAGVEEEKKRIKTSITTISTQTRLIKDFEKNGVPKYPLLPEVKEYEEDLVLCQLYSFKVGTLYFELMNEYPEAKNTGELLTQLNNVSPKTEELDKQFDKEALTFTNSDKKISFVCNDKAKEQKFVFETSKQ